MKQLLIAAAVVAATITSAHAADVGVPLTVGQPGFYGQIDIGNFPQPQVINPQPVIILRGRTSARRFIFAYRRVTPNIGASTAACTTPAASALFFVQDNWYNREYVPRYQDSIAAAKKAAATNAVMIAVTKVETNAATITGTKVAAIAKGTDAIANNSIRHNSFCINSGRWSRIRVG